VPVCYVENENLQYVYHQAIGSNVWSVQLLYSFRAVLDHDHDRDLSYSSPGDRSQSLKFLIAIIYW